MIQFPVLQMRRLKPKEEETQCSSHTADAKQDLSDLPGLPRCYTAAQAASSVCADCFRRHILGDHEAVLPDTGSACCRVSP